MTAVRPTGGCGSTARMVGTTPVAIAAVSGVAAGRHRRKRRLANLAKKGAAGGRCPAICVTAVRCGGRLPDCFRLPGAGWAVGLGRAEAGRWPVGAYGGHVHCVICAGCPYVKKSLLLWYACLVTVTPFEKSIRVTLLMLCACCRVQKTACAGENKILHAHG